MSEVGTANRERPLLGQWAVVTGGSMGIGRAVAERFVDGGANVVIVAHGQKSLDEAVELVRSSASADQEVFGISADVASRPAVDQLFDTLRSRLPSLNIFVANAGTGYVTPFLEMTDQEFDAVVALNFSGTIRCVQLAGRMMVADPQPNSAIVLVSSIRALGRASGPTRLLSNQSRRQPGRPSRRGRTRTVWDPGQRTLTRNHRNTVDGQEPRRFRRGGRQRPARARR